jgi:DNA-directed RNA polymerase specialized sigma subunit
MAGMVMDGQELMATLKRQAESLPAFDRLVMMLRWAEGLSRQETALTLEADPASVLASEMRLRAWIAVATTD